MEGRCTSLNTSFDESNILIGDERGFVYIVSADSFDLTLSFKSLGSEINYIDTDDEMSIVIAYDTYISVFDRYQKAVQNFKIDIKSYGSVMYMKCIKNHIVIGCESSNFILLDSITGSELSVCRPKNWAVSSQLTFLRSEQNSVRNLGGTVDGQLFSFDIN